MFSHAAFNLDLKWPEHRQQGRVVTCKSVLPKEKAVVGPLSLLRAQEST